MLVLLEIFKVLYVRPPLRENWDYVFPLFWGGTDVNNNEAGNSEN
jgi:hypothetical protein